MNFIKNSTVFAILSILIYTTSTSAATFSSAPDLELGDTHPIVTEIQKFLNSNGYTINPIQGESGSIGYESNYFGSLTQKALSLFQSNNNIIPAKGYFGVKTKAKIGEMGSDTVASAKSGVLAATVSYPSCTSATKDGITWTFDARPCGTYVTGDWWVQGPVIIRSISPKPAGQRNGSMISPKVEENKNQGFDAKSMYKYNSALDVGKNISPSTPLTIEPNNSLVSSITNGVANYPVQMFGVLTIVDDGYTPPDGSFRPTPYGNDTQVGNISRNSVWNEDQIKTDVLQKKPKSAFTGVTIPDINVMASYFSHPWIELDINWAGGYNRPVYMSPHVYRYAKDLAFRTGDAGLLLNLDFTPAEKKDLLIGMIQVGLDNYAFIQNGGYYKNDGGHMVGRLTPVLVAAAVLNDGNQVLENTIKGSAMKFQEYQTTFFVGAQDIPPTRNVGVWKGSSDTSCRTVWDSAFNQWVVAKPPVVNIYCKYDGEGVATQYRPEDIGRPEWGIRHYDIKNYDNNAAWSPYRDINGSTHTATTLVANMLGLRDTINHEALFEYAKRYINFEQKSPVEAGKPAWGWPDMSEYTGGFSNPTPAFHKKYYNLFGGSSAYLPSNPVLTVDKVGSGTVTGKAGSYTTGSHANLTAVANPGYVFSSWTGCTSTSANTCDVLMDRNKTVTATFLKLNDGFSNGSKIKVSSAVSGQPYVNVRSTAVLDGVTNLLGRQNNGNQGTIIAGPSVASDTVWWNINYDTGPDGWSGQDRLLLSTTEGGGTTLPPTTPPTTGGTLSATCTVSNTSPQIGEQTIIDITALNLPTRYTLTWSGVSTSKVKGFNKKTLDQTLTAKKKGTIKPKLTIKNTKNSREKVSVTCAGIRVR